MIRASNMCDSAGLRRQRPLVLEVRDELERMILAGEVVAGERLNENSLAAQMGVSRAPVRDAARSLERDGLVTAVATQGVFVRKLSLDDALELYDLRAMIAGLLCARVAEKRDADVCAALRAQLARMADAIRASAEDTYFNENLAFHDRIAEAAGSKRAAALYVSLGKEVRLFRLRVLTGKDAMAVSHSEHDRIVSAIESGDVEAARREGSQHHLSGKLRLLDVLNRRSAETA